MTVSCKLIIKSYVLTEIVKQIKILYEFHIHKIKFRTEMEKVIYKDCHLIILEKNSKRILFLTKIFN